MATRVNGRIRMNRFVAVRARGSRGIHGQASGVPSPPPPPNGMVWYGVGGGGGGLACAERGGGQTLSRVDLKPYTFKSLS